MKILRILFLTIIYTFKANRALKKHGDNVYYQYAREWSEKILRIANININVAGLENLNNDETYIFAANHSDLFDIPVLHIALKHDFRIIYKKELEKIPIFGSGLLRSPYIGIIREEPHKAMKSIEDAISSTSGGKSVLVFPEGTRTKNGKLGEFKRGGFMIAARSGKPVVPIAITGTFGISSGKRFRIKSATVKIEIGVPERQIPENSKEEKQLMIKIRNKISAMLEK